MPGKIPRKPSGDSPAAEFMKAAYENMTSESKQVFVDGCTVSNTTLGKVVIPGTSGRRRRGSSVETMILLHADYSNLICRDVEFEILAGGKRKINSIGSDNIYVAKPDGLQCSATTIPGWGYDGTNPIWQNYTITYALDTSEPYPVFATATTFPDADTRPPAAGSGLNEWGEESDDYSSGGSRYQIRLNIVRTVTANGVPSRERVIPPWRKGEIIYVQELDQPETTIAGLITPAGESVDYIMVADGRQWARI